MQFAPTPKGKASAENLLERLLQRLRSHVIWDCALNIAPPLILALYLLVHLYRGAWLPQGLFIFLAAAVIGIGLLGIAIRYRPMLPSVRSAARLADEKAAAEDRFLTLATVEPTSRSQPFFARLREETSDLVRRIDLRRDFPYEIKRSSYRSVIGSIIVLALFHLLLPLVESTMARLEPHQQIGRLAEKMAQAPALAELARDLQSLARNLRDPDMAVADKQQLIEQMQKKIEEQQRNQEQKDDQDLLGETASTLKSMEQQSANSQETEQQKGSGNIQSNIPQEGQGQGKQTEGGGGDSKGGLDAQQSKGLQQGKTAQANPNEQVDEKNQQKQGGQANQSDKNQTGKDSGNELTGKTEGATEQQLGRSKSEGKGRSEENPQGSPPSERFTKPGEEGKRGLKGTRYVTVQLPEELAAEGSAESGATREGKQAKGRPRLPISNVPLPAHMPDAPSEKQNLPLEYRGIIR